MTKISKISALTALITLAFGMTVIGNAMADPAKAANTGLYNNEIKVTYAANGDILDVDKLPGCRHPKEITLQDGQLPADLSMGGTYPLLDIINANLLRVHGSPQGCYYYNPYTGRWECICCY
jgi:hypothetical protein